MFKLLNKILGEQGGKEVREVRKNQILYLIGIILTIACITIIFTDNKKPKKEVKKEEVVFDGVFGESFSKLSDEALIDKQADQIDKLEKRSKKLESERNKEYKDDSARSSIEKLEKKLALLEKENKNNKEALSVALLKVSKKENKNPLVPRAGSYVPLHHEDFEKKKLEQASLETIRFHRKKKPQPLRTPSNYVWGGTFAEGVMLTGAKGDAGINGSKNNGVVAIRLTSQGTMPNKKQSRLKDCVVLASSYGDLSDDSVVMHLERLSCASGDANFEKKVYGGVFDSDAMQDVRGKAILKTKPLLQYSAAAGLLAGIGDGLRNYGTAQSINTNGSITTFSATDLGRSALGGAVSAPSTQVANYIMKIVDIYHPVVKARAGRVVTVLFTQGFSIDHDFQKYQAVDVSKQSVSENNDSDDRGLRFGFLNKESKKSSASDFLNNNKGETLFTNVDKNGGGK